MHILLAQADEAYAQRLIQALEKCNFSADWASDSNSCQSYAEFGNYSLIVLDTNLTSNNSFCVLKELRRSRLSTPVLIISDRREVADRVEGLDSGADDYLCKPFALDEFKARVRALSRRKDKLLEFSMLTFGDIVLDLNTNELLCNGHTVHLGLKEFQILKLLIANGKQILPKERLVENVWGINSSAEYNKVEVYISFLRRKLNKLSQSVTINTVRGIGYNLIIK